MDCGRACVGHRNGAKKTPTALKEHRGQCLPEVALGVEVLCAALVASTSSSLITSMCININTNIDSRRGLRRRSQQRGDMQVGLPRARLPTREGGAAMRMGEAYGIAAARAWLATV